MHIIYISTLFVTVFGMIMHVLRFGNFQSDHKLLCRISWKVFAKNLRRIKKNYALRNPLIWCQMSKCPEWVTFRLIWLIFVGFRHDNASFVIFDFWLRPQSAVWDLLKSFCKKSETNQKKLCSEKSTHLMSNVKMSIIGDFHPIWGVSWCFRHDYTRFEIFEFWVIRDQMSKCLKLTDCRLFWAISWRFRHDYTRFVVFGFWVIWDQMSKCQKLTDYRLNLPIFVIFCHDNACFMILEFWVKPQPAMWDLQHTNVYTKNRERAHTHTWMCIQKIETERERAHTHTWMCIQKIET